MTADPPQWDKREAVCVVGLRGFPNVMGGVETHCEQLLPRLAKLDPELQIEVVARQHYVKRPPFVFQGIRVVPKFAPKSQSFEAIVSTLIGIVHARRIRAKLLHVHAIGPALLTPLAKLLGLKVVITHHGADYERLKWGCIARLMLRLGEHLGVRFADVVIAVAPSLSQMLKRRYPARSRNIYYIPNGRPVVDPISPDKTLAKELGAISDPYLLAVGRLVPEKGFHVLIDAFRRSRCAATLVIVGAADHDSAYSRSLLEQGDERVIFAGVQPRHVVQQLCRNAALFVLPSFHEGLPIAAIEAGSLACPMLLSDIQPNRDLGLPERNYFAVGDSRALAACLDRSFEDFTVDPSVFDEFDWDKIAVETLAVYRSALGPAPPGR